MGLFKKLREIDANSSRTAKYEERKAEIKAKQEERKAARTAANTISLVMPLNDRGEKLLAENLSKDEEIRVKLQGSNGQAFVLTNRRLYIVKWGFMTNQTFGGKCIAYEYRNVTALEIRKKMSNRYIQVLTPASQDNIAATVWEKDKNGNNAMVSDSIVTYNDKRKDGVFQEAVNLGRQLISQAHTSGAFPIGQDDSLAQLEKLAELKQKGVITDEEFAAKKKQMLGL